MTVENAIKKLLKQGIEKLFDLDKLIFEEIIVKKEVIEEIREFAEANYPREFVAFLQGAILDKRLVIDKLIYQQYQASENSAVPVLFFGRMDFYGSVHSHPSGSNRPSRADLEFFRKTGIVHCIISKPFEFENARFYNHNGEEIMIKIED